MLARILAPSLLILCASAPSLAAPSDPTPAPMDDDEAKPPVSNYLKRDAFSVDVAFPGGGSALGTNSIGVRYFHTPNLALALHLQYGFDDIQEFSAYGGTFRSQWFLKAKQRAVAYSFAQVSVGATKLKNPSKLPSTSEGTQMGAAGGAGIELFIMPELSTSVELGIGFNALPSNKNTMTTSTSAIALHYFFTE
jgi:hypothetical protein